MTRYLTEQLRLVVNQEKSHVVSHEQFEFLGFSFPKSRGNINVAPKSIRRLSKTIATGVGLTNAWLHDQGLPSLKALWSDLAPLRRTARVAEPHARR